MTAQFKDSVFIITGAASGIGREIALQAVSEGAFVLALDWNVDGLNQLLNIAQSQNLTLVTHVVDVANAEVIKNFAQEIIPTLNGRRLILVNNAGVALLGGHWWDMTMPDTEWLLSINQFAVLRMTWAFLPYMRAHNDGYIVNISSVFGLSGVAQHLAYSTSKFAVRGFTESLRMELMGTNIGTLCVHPGGIKTDIVNHARRSGNMIDEQEHRNSHREFTRNALTSASKAAALILRAVSRGKKRLLIGYDAYFFDFVTRLFPVQYTKIISFVMGGMFTNPYREK